MIHDQACGSEDDLRRLKTLKLPRAESLWNWGELLVVPKGVEHLPVAEEECELLLIKAAGTPNTLACRRRPHRPARVDLTR
jgi:hypothetical protein